MRTTGTELASEAAIYAEGTNAHGHELARLYNQYADDLEADGADPDDFQRWAESEGFGVAD